MVFASYYLFLKNRIVGRVLDFVTLSDPPKNKKKKYGRATVNAGHMEEAEIQRVREANRGMSNVEKVLVKTCKL